MHPRQNERKLIALVESGEFEIDDLGRIWRLKIRHGIRSGGVITISIKRRRAERKDMHGYLTIRSKLDGKYITTMAHRLIWQHLFGDIPDGLIVNHKNGIKLDNRPENLEVVTFSEDTKHAFRLDLLPSGERHPFAKLSDEQIVEIRSLYASGDYRQLDLARMFNVVVSAISDIVKGKSRRKQAGPIISGDQRRREET